MMDEPGSKADLRVAARRARAAMSLQARDLASMHICASIAAQSFFQRASALAIYLPGNNEVSCWPLIERGWRMKKRIFAPVVKKNSLLEFCELRQNAPLRRNKYQIPEPVDGQSIDARRLDLVIVPLLAFDPSGNRLGMGGGYYDRAFSFVKSRRRFAKPKLVGAAFNCQRFANIPASPWDIPLFQVITESGTALVS